MTPMRRNTFCTCGRPAAFNTSARIAGGFPWRCARCFEAEGAGEAGEANHGAPLPRQSTSQQGKERTMRTTLFACLASAALGALVAGSDPAEAGQAICKERAELIKILGRKFGETQQSYGLQSDRRVLELYASPSGSWTAILTLPNGKSCVVASGEAWTVLPPEPVGEPA